MARVWPLTVSRSCPASSRCGNSEPQLGGGASSCHCSGWWALIPVAVLFPPTDDDLLIRDAVERFASESVTAHAERWDRDASLPAEAWIGVLQLGLLGAFASEEHGGAGLGARSVVQVIIGLARADASLALVVASHNVAGYAVDRFGSDADRGRYLEKLAAGELRATWVDGSDALETSSAPDASSVRLRGESSWVFGGRTADLLAITIDAGRAALAAPDAEWVRRGSTVNGLGLRAAEVCQISFHDAELGGLPEPAGAETRTLMSILRAATLVGLAEAALHRARAYAKERTQFGKPIASFQAIQWKLADMATSADAARLLTLRAAAAFDDGEVGANGSARAEMFAGRAATNAAYEAIQIFGGNGFVKDYAVERTFRDAKLLEVWAGPKSGVIADALLDSR